MVLLLKAQVGVEGLETTIRDPTIQSVTANVTFRNLDKTAILSNDLSKLEPCGRRYRTTANNDNRRRHWIRRGKSGFRL
jgi:hypothetical protein